MIVTSHTTITSVDIPATVAAEDVVTVLVTSVTIVSTDISTA